jgi:hypothetical protein
MSKSNLVEMELSGALRKIHNLNILDKKLGIINLETHTVPRISETGLVNFASGANSEEYGLTVFNTAIAEKGVSAFEATRSNGVAVFSINIKSLLDERQFDLKYPHGGYELWQT